MTFGVKKTRMAWLPDSEQNVVDMFIRFDRIHKHDRKTHTETDGQTPQDGIGHTYA